VNKRSSAHVGKGGLFGRRQLPTTPQEIQSLQELCAYNIFPPQNSAQLHLSTATLEHNPRFPLLPSPPRNDIAPRNDFSRFSQNPKPKTQNLLLCRRQLGRFCA
jgi:hypothetical protein